MNKVICYLKLTLLIGLGRKTDANVFYRYNGKSKYKVLTFWHDLIRRGLKRSSNERCFFSKKFKGDLKQFDRNKQALPGISIVTACMNRNDNLRVSIDSWLKLPVNEIIIVDWSSDQSVRKTLSNIKDARLKVCRVEGEKTWHLTRAFNVGFKVARFTKIYKLDADIKVSKDFLTLNTFSEGQYIRGHWKQAYISDNKDQIFVNGSFGAFKKDLKRIGYYNEYIKTYGWDDTDLYQRMNADTISALYLKPSSIHHLPQNEISRTKYQNINSSLFLGEIKHTEYHNIKNKYLSSIWDYWRASLACNYTLKIISREYLVARVSSLPVEWPRFIEERAGFLASLYFIKKNPEMFESVGDLEKLALFLDREFEAGINFEVSSDLMKLSFKQFSFDAVITNFRESSQSSKHSCHAFEGFNKKDLVLLNEVRADLGVDEIVGLISNSNSKIPEIHKPKLILDAQHGLGNRLRALVSAMVFAKQSGRDFSLVWTPDEHCECEFSDLFSSSDFQVHSVPLSNKELINYTIYNYMEIEDGANKDAFIVNDNSDVYIKSAYVLNYEGGDWTAEHEALLSLELNDNVKKLIEGVGVTEFDIALHIRMQGAAREEQVSCDGIHNWGKDSHEEIVRWRKSSHFSNFISYLKALEKKQKIDSIFLAADNEDAYRAVESEFPDKIHRLNRCVYDRSKEQLYYALADAILLSKGRHFLGSGWSSFSELATRYAGEFEVQETCGVDF